MRHFQLIKVCNVAENQHCYGFFFLLFLLCSEKLFSDFFVNFKAVRLRVNAKPLVLEADFSSCRAEKRKRHFGYVVNRALFFAWSKENLVEALVAPDYASVVIDNRHRHRKIHERISLCAFNFLGKLFEIPILALANLKKLSKRKSRNSQQNRKRNPENKRFSAKNKNVNQNQCDNKRAYCDKQNIAFVKISHKITVFSVRNLQKSIQISIIIGKIIGLLLVFE